MSRAALADAIRPFGPKGRLLPAHGPYVDALADALGLAQEAEGLRVSAAGLDLIKSFEGCRLTAYPDPGSGGDPWTIGWGSTGPDIRKGTVWTQEQADRRFAEHAAQFAEGVSNLINGAATTQGQFDAMVSLAYNVGLGNFGSSTLLKMHRSHDYTGAASQFMRWNRAAGKVMAGLTRRREAEARMYRGLS